MARRLLLVEDTPTIARLQTLIAQRAGYQVDVATSLAQAKSLTEDNNYYCAVVDFVLPDAHNGEAIDFVLSKNIPCIVMTAQMNDDVHTKVNQKPIVEYITKENHQSYHYLAKRLASLPRNEKTKVLVVDDSRSSREYMITLLKRQHYQVITAIDGVEALEQLQKHEDIRMIITDNEMPRMDGAELCAIIRERYSPEDKIVIGISSSNNLRLSSRFLKNGANDFLHKPFNEEEFYCRVNQNIDLLEQFEIIRQQANLDYLTELANRRYFFHSGEKLITKFAKHERNVCLAMLDLDNFKRINDTYGHEGGDAALKYFTGLFKEYFDSQLIARLGGEEFALLFKGEDIKMAMGRLVEFCADLRDHPFEFNGHQISLSVSVGVVEAHKYDLDLLLCHADNALYEAKSKGRDQIVKRCVDDG
ncbi:diguanylate cyclase [Pseudoalteromonas sp. SSDWG2]|uniref:GGDEF domain-containing response regulator n=1 Tax=Pseudoalteromonas sp. SSDWG2 TaxID=3139391 RepID=UPI003BAB97EE